MKKFDGLVDGLNIVKSKYNRLMEYTTQALLEEDPEEKQLLLEVIMVLLCGVECMEEHARKCKWKRTGTWE